MLGASIQVGLALYYSAGGMIDDSFISFRYAENLAGGHGPVYNPGDPPVEGYSNLLWVLALAALSAMGLGTVVAAKWLGILCAVGILICAWLLAEELAASYCQ